MAMKLIVSPAGADINGGGFDKATFTGSWSDWHDGDFGPLVAVTGATHDASELTITKAGLGAASAVGVMAYVSGTNIDPGHYLIVEIPDENTIYIGSLNSSGDNTDTVVNVGGALLNPQTGVDLWSEGEILLAPGVHDISYANRITLASLGVTPTYNNWLRIHGVDANGVKNPATKPKLDASGTWDDAAAMLNLAGIDYTMTTGLELDGNDITNCSYAIYDGGADAAYAIIDNVIAHNVKSHGIMTYSSTLVRVLSSVAYSNGGIGIIGSKTGLIWNCLAYSNVGVGISPVAPTIAVNCRSYNNGTVIPISSNAASVGPSTFINCIAANGTTTNAGFDLFNNTGANTEFGIVLKNCISMGNGYGFNFGDVDERAFGIYMDGCIAYNNTYGDEYWMANANSAIYLEPGDYVTGTELLQNGGFDDATGWTVNGAGTEITGGVVTMTGTSAAKAFYRTSNDVGLVAGGVGKVYAIKYTVTANTLNAGTVIFGSTTPFNAFIVPQTAGTHTVLLKSTKSDAAVDFHLAITATSTSGSISLDNISVKEISADAFMRHQFGGVNRNTEPPFVDATNNDYRLKSGHPNFSLLYDKTTGTLNGPLGPSTIGGGGGWITLG